MFIWSFDYTLAIRSAISRWCSDCIKDEMLHFTDIWFFSLLCLHLIFLLKSIGCVCHRLHIWRLSAGISRGPASSPIRYFSLGVCKTCKKSGVGNMYILECPFISVGRWSFTELFIFIIQGQMLSSMKKYWFCWISFHYSQLRQICPCSYWYTHTILCQWPLIFPSVWRWYYLIH